MVSSSRQLYRAALPKGYFNVDSKGWRKNGSVKELSLGGNQTELNKVTQVYFLKDFSELLTY